MTEKTFQLYIRATYNVSQYSVHGFKNGLSAVIFFRFFLGYTFIQNTNVPIIWNYCVSVYILKVNMNWCPLLFSVNTLLADSIKIYGSTPTSAEPIEPSRTRLDAESKCLWQRFTTSAGQLSEAINVHFWILGACLYLRASGLVSL